MSSQPTSPAAGVLSSSQQQQQLYHHSETNSAHQQTSSSPRSRVDGDGSQEGGDMEASFTSISSERHPKGKRKRTAAKDKVILESAYNANPKPDKAARLDIVKRVSLNEKEVQIWFQNRRQNDRRKSRPLSPQEIAALQYGSMQVLPEYANIGGSGTASQPPSSSMPTTVAAAQITSPELQSSSAPERVQNASPHSTVDNGRWPDEERGAAAHDTRRESAGSAGLSSSQPLEFTAGPSAPPSRSNSVGFFANRLHAGTNFQPVRRSPDSYRYDDHSAPHRAARNERPPPWLTTTRHEFMPAQQQTHQHHHSSSSAASPVLLPPLTQSSKYRLSMSVEGKAELVASRPSPPPRLSPASAAPSDGFVAPDRPHLYRSHSAADAAITLPPISTFVNVAAAPPPASSSPQEATPQVVLQAPRPHRSLYRSRSRDVHAWERACEANAGRAPYPRDDELTAYAERESSGSAIAAISLLRTLSSSSHPSSPVVNHHGHVTGPHHHVFQSNTTNKRNARPSHAAQHHHSHSHGSHHHVVKKPRLNRAASSIARLQNNYAHSTENRLSPRQRPDDYADEDEDDIKKAKMTATLLLSPSGNDSDKENWVPSDVGPHYNRSFPSSQRLTSTGRRPLPSKPTPSVAPANSSRRRVLDDGATNRFLVGRASTAPTSGRRRRAETVAIEIFQDNDDDLADASDEGEDEDDEREPVGVVRRRQELDSVADEDDEVERFMRGEGVSPGKRGAASAIAGLLALSQGAWR